MKIWVMPLLSVSLLSACVVHEPPRRGYGPPAHAPAHGYRKKYDDRHYDDGLGVYVMTRYPGYYFWDDHYYRLIDGRWHIGISFGGPWRIVDVDRVPHRLYQRHPGKAYRQGYKDGYREGREDDRGGHHKGKDKNKGKGKGKGKGNKHGD